MDHLQCSDPPDLVPAEYGSKVIATSPKPPKHVISCFRPLQRATAAGTLLGEPRSLKGRAERKNLLEKKKGK